MTINRALCVIITILACSPLMPSDAFAASDRVPKLNVEATCRGAVETDKAMGLALPQSFDKCMADENAAQQQLEPIWSSYAASLRATCEGEATAVGTGSYVDLLTCLQMSDGSVTSATRALKGASRKRMPD